jgi:hypothetical protein
MLMLDAASSTARERQAPEATDMPRRLWLGRLGVAGLALGTSGWPIAGLADGTTQTPTSRPIQPGDVVGWPSVSLIDGSTWGPAQAEGHAVVVVWWSLTCPFCVRHNGRLSLLQDHIDTSPLRIITAVREPDAAATRRHLQQHGHRLAVTLEATALARALGVTRRISPLTATVDRRGRLQQLIPGEMAESDVMGLISLARA